MARGSGQDGASAARRRGRTPEQARLVERFKRLGPQRDAFKIALRPFSDDHGHFDRQQWQQAFSSNDPDRIVTVAAATGLYVGLVNHLVEAPTLRKRGGLPRYFEQGQRRARGHGFVRAPRPRGVARRVPGAPKRNTMWRCTRTRLLVAA